MGLPNLHGASSQILALLHLRGALRIYFTRSLFIHVNGAHITAMCDAAAATLDVLHNMIARARRAMHEHAAAAAACVTALDTSANRTRRAVRVAGRAHVKRLADFYDECDVNAKQFDVMRAMLLHGRLPTVLLEPIAPCMVLTPVWLPITAVTVPDLGGVFMDDISAAESLVDNTDAHTYVTSKPFSFEVTAMDTRGRIAQWVTCQDVDVLLTDVFGIGIDDAKVCVVGEFGTFSVAVALHMAGKPRHVDLAVRVAGTAIEAWRVQPAASPHGFVAGEVRFNGTVRMLAVSVDFSWYVCAYSHSYTFEIGRFLVNASKTYVNTSFFADSLCITTRDTVLVFAGSRLEEYSRLGEVMRRNTNFDIYIQRFGLLRHALVMRGAFIMARMPGAVLLIDYATFAVHKLITFPLHHFSAATLTDDGSEVLLLSVFGSHLARLQTSAGHLYLSPDDSDDMLGVDTIRLALPCHLNSQGERCLVMTSCDEVAFNMDDGQLSIMNMRTGSLRMVALDSHIPWFLHAQGKLLIPSRCFTKILLVE